MRPLEQHRFDGALERIENYTKQHRSVRRLERFRVEWLERHHRLASAASAASRDVEATAVRFAVPPRDSVAAPHVVSLRAVVQALGAEPTPAETALVAEVLLRARQAHEAAGDDLARTEAATATEAADSRRTVFRALKESDDLELGGDAEDDSVEALKHDLSCQWSAQHAAWRAEDESYCVEATDPRLEGCARNASFATALERARLCMPELSEAELIDQLRRRDVARKHKLTRRGVQHEREAWRLRFKADARAAVAKAVEEARARKELEQDQQDLETRRQELHDVLSELRSQKRKRDGDEAAARAEAEARRLEWEARDRQRRETNQRSKRDAVLAYKATLAAAREEAARSAEERDAREKRRKEKRLQTCAERSRFREALRDTKLDAARQDKQRALDTEAARLRALARIAASAPYADAVANAKADLSRTTIATENGKYVYDESHPPALVPFDDASLVRDVRFRLATALRAAGLAYTCAARAAVDRAHGPRDPIPYATSAAAA